MKPFVREFLGKESTILYSFRQHERQGWGERERREGGRENLSIRIMPTCLGPELDVFYPHSDQPVSRVGVPAKHKDLVLVSPCRCQPLPLSPLPHHNRVVVVQPH